MDLIIALSAWALKECYQSYIGSRAKTLESVQFTEKKIIRLEALVETQTKELERLQATVLKLSNVRAYRD